MREGSDVAIGLFTARISTFKSRFGWLQLRSTGCEDAVPARLPVVKASNEFGEIIPASVNATEWEMGKISTALIQVAQIVGPVRTKT
jgi:hypothetical protein